MTAIFPQINPSPFCIKLMTFFKVFNVEHSVIKDTKQVRKSPKNKLPFITTKNRSYGDSRLIVEMYKEQFNLESTLSGKEKATSVACRRMLEEHIYFYSCVLWIRDKAKFNLITAPDMPWFIRPIFLWYLHRAVTKQLYSQGIGRLNTEEQELLIEQDFLSLETILNESTTDYFFNKTSPGHLDIVAFSFLYSYYLSKDKLLGKCPSLIKLIIILLKDYYPSEYDFVVTNKKWK